MTFKQKISVIFAVVVALFGGGVAVKSNLVGSVSEANGYYATTTLSSWANAPHSIRTSGTTTFTPGIIGSVVIGTTDASIVQIMDATSSTDIASTSIAVLAASPANGSTLVLDANFTRGLMINTVTGFAGRYTITWR